MRIRHPKDADSPTYQWGDIGGRTTHPMDPDGSIFGPTHWPKAQPHELKHRVASRPPEIAPTPRPPRPATTTGLTCLADFLAEAKRLNVLTPELRGKLKAVYDKKLPNPGIYRMQCNNLLRNAIKKLSQKE